jgi:cellulose synthase (UDP-forming)
VRATAPWPAAEQGRGFIPLVQDRRYAASSTVAGELQPAAPQVRYERVLNRPQRRVLALLIAFCAVSSLVFLGWLAWPTHLPDEAGTAAQTAAAVAFGLILVVEIVRVGQNSTLWMFAAAARDPVPMQPRRGLRVAVLTTIVPASEPIEVVAHTLIGMRRLRHDGPVDVWILDEGDDPAVRRLAEQLGVRHFSRANRPEYNQPAGPFRARSKAGNHNAWRAEHEQDYDVVAQMDPDHVPLPDFLQRTLGYFADPDVAFVVAPQVYGNTAAGFVPQAAAEQSYLFHGIVQRGGNGLGAPLLIGTNHLYRPAAWAQIGGYQDSVIEDHLTSLHVHAARNPVSGERWKGVYTPDVLAVGEGPTSWTDYFNQQKRWAYGIWDVLLRHSPRLLPRLSGRQRLSYLALQWFYPSVGVTWLLGNLLTAAYLVFGVHTVDVPVGWWAGLWGASALSQQLLFFWLRRFNLVEHERRELGLRGLVLSLVTGPVYVAAAVSALLRRRLHYVVTAKGHLASPDSWRTFRHHAGWAVVAVALLAASVLLGHYAVTLRAWAMVTLAAAAAPILVLAARRRRVIDLRQQAAAVAATAALRSVQVPEPALRAAPPAG